MNEREGVRRLADWLKASERTVFFGGAGISTESGIPDFRSQDGLYRQQFPYPPEVMLSHSFFQQHPEEFFHFYRSRMLYRKARPNAAHLALARLEALGKLHCVATQNIDGLHQAAGSQRVYELHGSVLRNRCVRCGKQYPVAAVAEGEGIPRCACGGIIKPEVVLYEESLPEDAWEGALAEIRRAELLIVGGTSLSVYPAASLVSQCPGRIALINRTPTPYDGEADLVLHASAGEILAQAVSLVSQ